MLLIFGMAFVGCEDETNKINVNNEAKADSSTEVTGETSRAAVAKPSTPSAPKVTATTSSSIAISWPSVTGASGYYVYRSTSPSSGYTRVGTAYSTTYTSTGLNSNATYYYKVSAFNSAGEGSQSSYVSGKTLK